MPARTPAPRVRDHFMNCAPDVEKTYAAILAVAKRLGPFREEAKKTSIHLVRKSAFAGVATRKSALILTLKSKTDVPGKRIIARERASAGRWHLEVRLTDPSQVDTQLARWLEAAYEISG